MYRRGHNQFVGSSRRIELIWHEDAKIKESRGKILRYQDPARGPLWTLESPGRLVGSHVEAI